MATEIQARARPVSKLIQKLLSRLILEPFPHFFSKNSHIFRRELIGDTTTTDRDERRLAETGGAVSNANNEHNPETEVPAVA